MARYTFVGGGSSKFWEGSVEGSVLAVKFGRIGTAGQTKDKDLGSPAAAQKELDKLIREKLKEGYVEEGGSGEKAPAASTASTGSAASASSGGHPIPEPYESKPGPKGKYPFLFYGASPNDYTDGDLTFDVRFAETSDKAGRLEIAEAFEKAAYKSGIDPDAGNWRWCGPWALITVSPSLDNDDGPMTGTEKVLKKLHEAVPIAEVINWSVMEDAENDHWTRWSFLQHGNPSPEPAWANAETVSQYLRQSVDKSLGEGEEDKAFEKRREQVRIQLELGPAVPKGKIGLAPAGKQPRPAEIPEATKKFWEGYGTLFWGGGVVVAADGNGSYYGKLSYLDAKGKIQTAPVEGTIQSGCVADDGKSVLFSATNPYGEFSATRIFEMTLPGGVARELIRFGMGGNHDTKCAYLGKNRIAVAPETYEFIKGVPDGLSPEFVYLLDRKTGRILDRSEFIVDVYELMPARDGRLLFVSTGKNSKPVQVFRTDGDALEKLGSVGPLFWMVWERDGKIYAGSRAQVAFEVVNADEILAKKPAARRFVPNYQAENWVVSVPADKSAPRPAPVPDAIKSQFADAKQLATSPDGRAAAVTRDGKVAYLDAAGKRQEAAGFEGEAVTISLNADASIALFATVSAPFAEPRITKLYQLDLPSGKVTHYYDSSNHRDECAVACMVGEDRIAYLLYNTNLCLMEHRVDGDQKAIVQDLKGALRLSSLRDGAVLFVHSTQKPHVLVYGVKGDKFGQLGLFNPDVETFWEAGGKVYGGNPDDPDAPVFEVINLDAAIAGRM